MGDIGGELGVGVAVGGGVCVAVGVGVTGGTAANALAAEADLILAVGTRLSDFTTASRSLFRTPSATLVQLNVAAVWNETVMRTTAPSNAALPSDAQVLGTVNRAACPRDVIVCAAGGLPGELHKLWRCREAGTYHVEYGYSCMGYEIAGGLGTKLAMPDHEVWVLAVTAPI